MTMQDPVADMLTRIRNAQTANKKEVEVPMSRIKLAIAKVLKDEGYIIDYGLAENNKHKTLKILLKYYEQRPVIEMIKRVSRPGLRVYAACDDFPKVMGGFGISIISTSRGVMSDKVARRSRLGGEVICLVA